MGSSAVFFRLALLLTFGLFSSAVTLHAEVLMKSRKGEAGMTNRTSQAKSRQAGRSHLILDFEAPPTPETVRLLTNRGLRVVAYLPLTGMIVSIQGEPDLESLPIRGFDAFQAADKISEEIGLAAGDRTKAAVRLAFFIVDFHSDVPWEERRSLVVESGLEVRDHRDLAADHMLVRGTVDQVQRLAEWDEVAYIFPASGELAAGLPLIGCVGGATEAGPVGQMTQRVGEGWDGPGQGAAELTYSMQGMPRGLPEELVQEEVRRAMAAWSQVAQVKFQRTAASAGSKNINILFGAREHGDPYPFDGAGKVLAHTFYPAPPNPEPIAGDLHFDGDESWNLGSDIDVFSVALHELGHALGLGHSDVPNAVMYPYYRRATALTPEDVGAIRMLYAAAQEPAPAPPPLVLSVTSPASPYTTQASAITLTGTVSGASAAPSVAWSTDLGPAGNATVTADGRGGFQWQAAGVAVSIGANKVTVTARMGAAQPVSRVLNIQRLAATTPTTPPPDPTPTPTPTPTPVPALTLEIASPSANAAVARNSISSYGSITGATGRPSVRWSSDRGFSGTAVIAANVDGSFRWDVNPLSLLAGANKITVTATDTANRTSIRTILVTYSVPPEENPTADTTPPRVTITSPNTTFLMTPAYSLAVRGTASDSAGVSEIRWECSCGARGVLPGATQWAIPNISIPIGTSIIKVTAKDPSGNEGVDSFTVFRYAY